MGSFCSTDDSSDKNSKSNARKPNEKPQSAPSETEESVTYDPSVTVDNTVLSAAKSYSQVGGSTSENAPGVDNNSFKIMVTPPDDAEMDGPVSSQDEYNKIKDDIKKRRDEAGLFYYSYFIVIHCQETTIKIKVKTIVIANGSITSEKKSGLSAAKFFFCSKAKKKRFQYGPPLN